MATGQNVNVFLGNVSEDSGDELVGKALCWRSSASVGTDFIIVCNDDKKPSATTLPEPTYAVVRALLVSPTLEIPEICGRPIERCVKEDYIKKREDKEEWW